MKILLVGHFSAGSLESSYSQAFFQLGHIVSHFDITNHNHCLRWWLRSRLSHRLTLSSLILRRAGSKVLNEALIDSTEHFKPDIVVSFNGFFLFPDTACWIRSRGSKFVLVHADNPLPGNYNFRPEVLPLARASNHFFIWSSRLAEALNGMGVHASFLPFAWDSDYTPFQGFKANNRYDVTFIGGWDRERESFLEQIANRYDLKIWGPSYWSTRTKHGSKLKKCWQGMALRGHEMASVLASSSIALNIYRTQHYFKNKPIGTIMRTFEVPGAGGFLISTRSNDSLAIFPEGISGAYFGNLQECFYKIDYYLSNPSLRIELMQASHDNVSRHHTYRHRAQQLLDTVLSH